MALKPQRSYLQKRTRISNLEFDCAPVYFFNLYILFFLVFATFYGAYVFIEVVRASLISVALCDTS